MTTSIESIFDSVNAQIEFCKRHDIFPNGKIKLFGLYNSLIRFFSADAAASGVTYEAFIQLHGAGMCKGRVTFLREGTRPVVELDH